MVDFCHATKTIEYERKSKIKTKQRTHSHLFDDDPINMRVKSSYQQSRKDDRCEVQEDEIVVIHDFRENAFLVGLLSGVPTEQRQKAHQSSGDPANADYAYTKRK